jgi:hypothetical protein
MSQPHALIDRDRQLLARVQAAMLPGPEELVTAARLRLRYDGNPSCSDIVAAIDATLKRWGLTLEEVNAQVRDLWHGGWRPGIHSDAAVGSGADVNTGPD